MTVQTFVIGSLAATIVSWGIWLMVLLLINPQQAGALGFALFFLTLFLALASTASLLGYGARRLMSREQLAAYAVRYSLRQGLLLGIFVDILLILQTIRLMRWWLVLLMTVIFLSLEFVFLSYDHARKRNRQPAS